MTECCTLRLRDLDFDRRQIIVRGGKGDKDRIVMLPASLVEAWRNRSVGCGIGISGICKGGRVCSRCRMCWRTRCLMRRRIGGGSLCFPARTWCGMRRAADIAGNAPGVLAPDGAGKPRGGGDRQAGVAAHISP